MPKIHTLKECLPQDPNSDEDLTDDQIIDGLMKLTAESLAEQYDSFVGRQRFVLAGIPLSSPLIPHGLALLAISISSFRS